MHHSLENLVVGEMEQQRHFSTTEFLSRISDHISGPITAFAARELGPRVPAPKHFVELLLLIEDKRFILHLGIDLVAVARALIFNARGFSLQGASTIPQQLYMLSVHLRTIRFKVKQSIWAFWQSVTKSKLEILKQYINAVYWGRSYYGLDNAASGYFRTDRESSSVAQGFFLAERIACPNRASPARIANLLQRPTIARALRRSATENTEIIQMYNRYYGCGGEICRHLGK